MKGFDVKRGVTFLWVLFLVCCVSAAPHITTSNVVIMDSGSGSDQPSIKVTDDVIMETALPGITSGYSKPEITLSRDLQSSIPLLEFPKTDKERQQLTNELKEKGCTDREIVAVIIGMILSANATDLDIGEYAEVREPILSPEKIGEMILELDIRVWDETVQDSSPYYNLLTLAEEQKPNFLSDIESSGYDPVINEFLKDSLIGIWKKYPVNYTTIGNRTIIRFDLENPNVILTPEENEILKEVDMIHLKKMAENIEPDPKWSGQPVHGDFVYWAIYQNVLAVHPLFSYAENARNHAPDPDQGLPWNAPEHYYNPDFLWGGAPGMAQQSFSYAKSYYMLQDYQQASVWIAKSSHYLTDAGNPFHTGKELDTIWNQTTHARYESWVDSHWTTPDFNFGDYVQGYYYDYLWSENPSDTTKSVAQVSHPYLETLWDRFYTYTDQQLADDAWIKDATRICISTSSKYINGLVDNWILTIFPGYSYYPGDINSDNLFEDINGNFQTDFDDIIAYYNNMDWIRSHQPFRLFDYNRNGAIDYDDVVLLYYRVLEG